MERKESVSKVEIPISIGTTSILLNKNLRAKFWKGRIKVSSAVELDFLKIESEAILVAQLRSSAGPWYQYAQCSLWLLSAYIRN